MAVRVELVYVEGCPHAEQARSHLRIALRRSGLPQVWVSWDRAGLLPDQVCRFPSPTVLVEGVDVLGGGSRAEFAACAIGGAPPVEAIVAALVRVLAGRSPDAESSLARYAAVTGTGESA